MNFNVLRQLESDWKSFLEPLEYYQREISGIKESLRGCAGEGFLNRWSDAFNETGSPIVVNLDHNVSKSNGLRGMVDDAKVKVSEMKEIVKATAGHVLGYKMNEQSMLTFLLAGEPNFVNDAKAIYKEVCADRFNCPIEPVLWTDEKLRDIPSTTYQTARIIFNLGFDAIHCMPQMGLDVAGALQVAADEMGGKGVIHVINLTHSGYAFAKENYFKEGTVDLLRRNALGSLETEVKINRERNQKVRIRATGTIEPANRPYELFQSTTKYEGNTFIFSIGIGPDQGDEKSGTWPGSAIYAGAHGEGIGRYGYLGINNKLDTMENIAARFKACKRSELWALKARYEGEPYPFDGVKEELGEFAFPLNDTTKKQLGEIYESRKAK